MKAKKIIWILALAILAITAIMVQAEPKGEKEVSKTIYVKKFTFPMEATIGMKNESRRWLNWLRDEVILRGGRAIVREDSNWFESVFQFEARDLDYDTYQWLKAQYDTVRTQFPDN
jgi:hypothetical protein